MDNPTIIRLGAIPEETTATFQEAFGEFSEVFGRKARARRQARKLERISRRGERQMARKNIRAQRKQARVDARMQRRMTKAEARQARKDLASERELARQQAVAASDAELAEKYGSSPEGEEGGEGEEEQGGGYQEESYPTSPRGGNYAYDENDENGYEEGGYDEGGYDEGGYDDENLEYFSGIDADIENASDFVDMSFSPEEEANVGDMANKLEWNLELVDRLKDAAESGDARVIETYNKALNRAKEIKSNMDAYCKFEGEFTSDASGKTFFKKLGRGVKKYHPVGIAASAIQKNSKKRRNLVAKKREQAREARNAVRVKNNRPAVPTMTDEGKRMRVYKIVVKINSMPLSDEEKAKRILSVLRRYNITKEELDSLIAKYGSTPVQAGLNPQFAPQQIIIPPATSSATGTGIIGIDAANDYDADNVEVKLGADGSGNSKIPFKAIGIGLAVGVIAVIVLRKYKII